MGNEDILWSSDSTGSVESTAYKIVKRRFDKYVIDLVLTQDNEFVNIIGVQVDQKYIDPSRVKFDRDYINVDELYNE